MAGRGKPQADSFPVEVHDDSPGPRGRWLRSSRDIRPGEVVLRCLPLSVAVADDQVERRCASCLRHLAEGEAQTVCEKRERHGCGVRLCAACSACERWQQIHRHGDCQSVRASARAAKPLHLSVCPLSRRCSAENRRVGKPRSPTPFRLSRFAWRRTTAPPPLGPGRLLPCDCWRSFSTSGGGPARRLRHSPACPSASRFLCPCIVTPSRRRTAA